MGMLPNKLPSIIRQRPAGFTPVMVINSVPSGL
jgi:hypothetical protein